MPAPGPRLSSLRTRPSLLTGPLVPTPIEVMLLSKVPSTQVPEAAMQLLIAVPDAEGAAFLPLRVVKVRRPVRTRHGVDALHGLLDTGVTKFKATFSVLRIASVGDATDACDVAVHVEAALARLLTTPVAIGVALLATYEGPATSPCRREGIVETVPAKWYDANSTPLTKRLARSIALETQKTRPSGPSPNATAPFSPRSLTPVAESTRSRTSGAGKVAMRRPMIDRLHRTGTASLARPVRTYT